MAGIELRILFRDTEWRRLLRDGDEIEVWTGSRCLGILSGESLIALVRHHLETAQLHTNMLRQLSAGPPEVRVLRVPTGHLKKPPAPLPAPRRKGRRKGDPR